MKLPINCLDDVCPNKIRVWSGCVEMHIHFFVNNIGGYTHKRSLIIPSETKIPLDVNFKTSS